MANSEAGSRRTPTATTKAGEVHDIVEAYHTGIVYDRADIEALIRTNLDVMWNGSFTDPKWRNSDATGPWAPPPPPPKGWKGRAGTLWTALEAFSDTVRRLHAARLDANTISAAYYKAVTSQQPISFTPRHATTLTPWPHSPTPSRDLTLAVALPAELSAGTPTTLATKTLTPDSIHISLLTPAHTHILDITTIHVETATPDGRSGIQLHTWTPPPTIPPGPYLIRWSLHNTHRTYPLHLAPLVPTVPRGNAK